MRSEQACGTQVILSDAITWAMSQASLALPTLREPVRTRIFSDLERALLLDAWPTSVLDSPLVSRDLASCGCTVDPFVCRFARACAL